MVHQWDKMELTPTYKKPAKRNRFPINEEKITRSFWELEPHMVSELRTKGSYIDQYSQSNTYISTTRSNLEDYSIKQIKKKGFLVSPLLLTWNKESVQILIQCSVSDTRIELGCLYTEWRVDHNIGLLSPDESWMRESKLYLL